MDALIPAGSDLGPCQQAADSWHSERAKEISHMRYPAFEPLLRFFGAIGSIHGELLKTDPDELLLAQGYGRNKGSMAPLCP